MINCALAQQDFLGADLILFPELALTGYPPEDLLLRPGFLRSVHHAVDELLASVQGIDVIIGHPWEERGRCYNAVSWIRDGCLAGRYFKQLLPNYAVFDEQRYFKAGSEPLVMDLKGTRIGVIICEDAWEMGPAFLAAGQGADLLLVPNASPYRDDKLDARRKMFASRHKDCGLAMIYCNLVGGQDELVFDGRSMLMDAQGKCSQPGPLCEEALLLAEFDPSTGKLAARDWKPAPENQAEEIYTVLVRGLGDYVRKNGFSDVVFGLSGGIDSALTLAIAVDALGAEQVHTVMMPSRHTSGLSLELAQGQAVTMGVDHRCISIEPAFEALLQLLEPSFQGREPDVTEENLQARVRGDIVMALSNKFGWLPLATSNKSELAVGYCTIYGDMCGGFGPLLDCIKTRVYELARYRNSISKVIPEAVITRAPSAELAPGQSDQDSLPAYDVLDQILQRYVELDWSINRIVGDGFEESMVRRIAGLVLLNEYKRRQAPPGVRVTHRAFGRDRRYPITSGWRESKSDDC
jgi:NAD+ synthase (glutamine-hydrolysing)